MEKVIIAAEIKLGLGALGAAVGMGLLGGIPYSGHYPASIYFHGSYGRLS